MNFNHVKVPELKLEKVTLEDGKRYYLTPEGKKYPSVTTMLSYFSKDTILEWRKRVGAEEANRISRQASNRGTKLHTIVE